jgi:hypothetical protein
MYHPSSNMFAQPIIADTTLLCYICLSHVYVFYIRLQVCPLIPIMFTQYIM